MSHCGSTTLKREERGEEKSNNDNVRTDSQSQYTQRKEKWRDE